MNKLSIEDVAELCHEMNRAFCIKLGDTTQLPWDLAPDWQRESAVNGVKHRLENPLAHPRASHESWMREKVKAGWVYGEAKDGVKKTHPCLVEFHELPVEQQAKDYLFVNIVMALHTIDMIKEPR